MYKSAVLQNLCSLNLSNILESMCKTVQMIVHFQNAGLQLYKIWTTFQVIFKYYDWNKLRKRKTASFRAAFLSDCFCYMAILCVKNKSVQLEIVSDFKILLYWWVSHILEDWNSNKIYLLSMLTHERHAWLSKHTIIAWKVLFQECEYLNILLGKNLFDNISERHNHIVTHRYFFVDVTFFRYHNFKWKFFKESLSFKAHFTIPDGQKLDLAQKGKNTVFLIAQLCIKEALVNIIWQIT